MKAHRIIATAALGLASIGASAAVFDFANLKTTGGVSSGFLPTDGVYCTGGDLCSSDVDHNVLNGDLSFASGGITVHATAFYSGSQVAVVQDHDNSYNGTTKIGAGLGVYHHRNDTSDDNVTTFESLVLTFDQDVVIDALGLASEFHNVNCWVTGATFLVNGVETLLPKGTGTISPLFLAAGDTFSFAYGGSNPDQFYINAMTVTAAVPEPETYALLLGGLGALGFLARRRRSA